MMAVVAISILPALSIEFDVDGFRREAFEVGFDLPPQLTRSNFSVFQ